LKARDRDEQLKAEFEAEDKRLMMLGHSTAGDVRFRERATVERLNILPSVLKEGDSYHRG
jgi:hypothetical protein